MDVLPTGGPEDPRDRLAWVAALLAGEALAGLGNEVNSRPPLGSEVHGAAPNDLGRGQVSSGDAQAGPEIIPDTSEGRHLLHRALGWLSLGLIRSIPRVDQGPTLPGEAAAPVRRGKHRRREVIPDPQADLTVIEIAEGFLAAANARRRRSK